MKRFFSRKLTMFVIACAAFAVLLCCFADTTIFVKPAAAESRADELAAAMEKAVYTRAEFFGAEAIVPFPTRDARKNLAALLEKFPNEPSVYLKLAELDEKLGDYAAAEQNLNNFVRLNSESQKSLETLTAYYERRAQFDRAAATLERILKQTKGDRRAAVFGRLLNLARRHKLENYLKPDFYRQVIAGDESAFAVIKQFIGKLIEEENYAEALEIVRQTRLKFPEQNEFLRKKEIEILIAEKKTAEAEAVYHGAFNPFWSEQKANDYYQFLSDNDRLRAYKNELRARVKKNPTNFDAAVRLFHIEKHDYAADKAAAVLLNLEAARAAGKIDWQPNELLTAARLFLAANDGAAASRFLYTLFAQNKLEKGSALRAKVLYQLFEMLSDAGEDRLTLANGNLDFYRDVAVSDSHPGIATGILSLIFSDTNPARELDKKEKIAARLFNRAAAYRVFSEYKAENPASPELAKMYLDLVRLDTDANETERAARTLAEFENSKEFAASPQYPLIALKLAEAFAAAKLFDKERAVYQRLLDYTGRRQKQNGQPLVPTSGDADPTLVKPKLDAKAKDSNSDADSAANSDADEDSNADADSEVEMSEAEPEPSAAESNKNVKYRDAFAAPAPPATYVVVLNLIVTSFNRERRTTDILKLYAAETAKYPNEAGLDEQMLQWLGQTNLIGEQLKVYQTANKKFPGTIWQDRLARWFLRQNRKADFDKYSTQLIENFDDAATQNYLAEFINRRDPAKPETFDARLYLALYTRAHQRFPHNLSFVKGLLDYYREQNLTDEWQRLTAEYYFAEPDVRKLFLEDLQKNGKLRDFQQQANSRIAARPNAFEVLPYKLFRADAAVNLSNYEDAVEAYRELDRLYPNAPEFAERRITLTRSLGQINRDFLSEAAAAAHSQAENSPAAAESRTRAGEIQAELGDYERARTEWAKLIETARGDAEIYLDTATVYWDYFQYDNALQTIRDLRLQKRDNSLYAFESGAIYEAQKNLPAALAEYVQALDGSTADADNVAGSDRAKHRLEQLYQRENVASMLQTAFADARRKLTDKTKIAPLVLGYADFLRRVKKWDEGRQLLKTEIAASTSSEFLTEARDLAAAAEDKESEDAVLRRLAATAGNPRSNIKYNLRLAAGLSAAQKKTEAAAVLNNLIAKFPNNYGVLSETADFYWRIGERENAVRILQTAMKRGRGSYRVTFGRKLAARLEEQKRLPAAEAVLAELYNENPLNYGVFKELTGIYVRTNNRVKLEEIFKRTLSEINAQDADFREINEQAASLRASMINALTRLKDYDAAIAQHIEIINRDPQNEENTAAAINYVQRYGGAEKLIDYYQKTANAGYKNYRWFVILARIYEAGGDNERAVQNYQTAIQNQPEMPELYDSLAALYERRGNYDQAIAAVNQMLKLSNDDPQYLRRLIKLLEQAGRPGEAESARQKLPVEAVTRQTLTEQFAAADNLKKSEKAKALALYQAAFNELLAKPLEHDLKTEEIVGYINASRGTEPLDQTASKLWKLRDQFVAEAVKPNSTQAGRARSQRQVLDAAIIEGIGSAARDFADEAERAKIYGETAARIEKAAPGVNETLQLLQNLSRRAGFGLLEEKIIIKQKDASFALGNSESYHSQLNSQIAFYRERGDYAALLNLLETERARDFKPGKYDYLRQIAENAALLGDKEKEFAALREAFERQCADCPATENEQLTARYFDALTENGANGRAELTRLTLRSSRHELELINFLLKKGERELAQAAIESSSFAPLWKQSRHAQTSLVLADFTAGGEFYFRAALGFKTIGELVKSKPQPDKQLVGDAWFRLTNNYGKWLSGAKKENADAYLPALLENRPRDGNEQTRLGGWYLEQQNGARALEHSQIALEMNPQDKNALANLGAGYLLTGDEAQALKTWHRLLEDKQPDLGIYLQTLQKYNRAAAGREAVTPILIQHLKDAGFDKDDLAAEIRLAANSFGDNKNADTGAAQAAFLLKIAESAPNKTRLAETVIAESLAAQSQLAPFYELLLKNTAPTVEVDYSFTALLAAKLNAADAEAALDAAENYQPPAPAGELIKWQEKYLSYLLEERQNERARALIGEIEKSIANKYARPAWLRLAGLRLDLAGNNAAETILPRLKSIVGINPNVEKIIPPSLERLNDAVKILLAAKQEAAADQLQEAVYARFLALDQFEKSTFASLAAIEFKRGNQAAGVKLLRIMVDLTDDQKKGAAARELDGLEAVKANAVDAAKIEDEDAENPLERGAALETAAATAAQFERLDAALDFRRELLAFAPENAENRIALARLFAKQQNFTQAANQLATVMIGAEASRKIRWQAVWTTAEVCGGRAEAWSALKNQAKSLETNSGEMWLALLGIEQWRTGHSAEAQNLLRKSAANNANLQFLLAVIAQENNQPSAAVSGFTKSLEIDQNAEIAAAVDAASNAALLRIIALYAANNQPLAALRLAENQANLRDLKLLETLSNVAEQIKDFKRAAVFETRRQTLLTNADEIQAAKNRLEFLRDRERELTSATATVLKVDRENVSE